jgi:putative oxidoreductase
MSGIGLLLGGTFISGDRVGDLLTRFSGIVICCIMTGVILIGEPESIWYVLLYDHLHLMLFCGGLFFVLRGNRVK